MSNSTASPPIKLPAVLDFAAAESFLHTMTGAIQHEDGVRLDASEVKAITFSCVQIILAAMKDCGDRLTIERPSEEFLRTFNELALGALLEPSLAKNEQTGANGEKYLDWVSQSEVGAAAAPDAPEIENPGVEVRTVEVPAVDMMPAAAAPAEEPSPPPEPVPEQVSATDDFEEAPMSKRILTIDDSRTIRDMLMVTLSGAGFNVQQANDGQEGIDVLDKETFDVVITDINMPKKDGYDVIRAMRANPAHKGIPILVLTTEADTEKRQIAREAGATGWMVKPFDPERLVATVRKVAP
ncbi:response regulator [Leptospira sp. severe_002]|uniref:response regulator n=1 Tax=Leptospira sp. severe_002 TaxID=2838237 RepID=UPI001E2945A6|nr:response regulator [Leptospira sp. severe_002]